MRTLLDKMVFEADLEFDYSELFNEYEGEQPYIDSEFDDIFELFDEYFDTGETYSEFEDERFDTELADEDWTEEIRRGRRRIPARSVGGRTLPRRRRRLRPRRRRRRPAMYRPRRRRRRRLRRPVVHTRWVPRRRVIALPEPQGTEYVRWVQSSLNRVLGLRLPVDGIKGPETRSAIRSFQQREGLLVNGIVGPKTERALIAALESLDSELADFEWEVEVGRSSRDYIRWIQRSLNQIMGLRLTVDGIMGPRTRSAVRRFQQRYGLTVDGIVGPRTEAALIASGVNPPPRMSRASTRSTTLVSPGRPDIVSVRGIRVARQIAPQVKALLTAAEADGIRLSGWGYRPYERQVKLRRRHCGPSHYDIYEKPSSQCTPPTARPGRSMHERGLAIDFTYNGKTINSRNNPAFRWLSQNAARFDLYNLPSEPWHWSVNGR